MHYRSGIGARSR